MLMKSNGAVQTKSAQTNAIFTSLFVFISVAIGLAAFSGPLLELVRRWRVQEEYSHGFLIPVIAAWLLWTRRDALRASIGRPSWTGPALILIAAAMHIVGKLSALFFLSQIGFIVALIGITLGLGGYSLLKVMFVPIIFLLFAIPLPYFIDAALSWRLQIISSQMGVFFIRLLHIPVFLEGNVIDLGAYKLQVVEACSGLRYLYPLMSLGFLAAYLFQAPLWQRAFLFLSTIPITIVMNSLRIGIVGVLFDYWGPQDADGFLHMFEGWIIFIACAGLLVAEMHLMSRLSSGKGFFDVFHPPKVVPSLATPRGNIKSRGLAPVIGCFLLMCATGLATFLVSTNHEIIPQRKAFAFFPTVLGAWVGHPSSLDRGTAKYLGLTDYILSDYAKPDGPFVNLYIAYYASQRTGLSPHSPSVCLPGNGWQMTKFEGMSYKDNASGIFLPLNRAIIARGSERELVYYWFDERGMTIANEYLSKLYLLRDAIFRNRTDGALVRLITLILPGERESDADKRLQEFIRVLIPRLNGYLPSGAASNAKLTTNSLKSSHS
jgi:exosortase D (VPLPA-CTERM-specific)